MRLIAKTRVLDGWQVEFLIILEKTSVGTAAASRSSRPIVYYNAKRGAPLAEGTMAATCYIILYYTHTHTH